MFGVPKCGHCDPRKFYSQDSPSPKICNSLRPNHLWEFVMVAGIDLAITSIKATTEAVKAVIGLRDKAKIDAALQDINAKLLATQGIMLTAYEERRALLAQVEELEKARMQVENWKREAARYQLKQIPPTVLVYALKKPVQGGEPEHYICPNCYNDRKKSLLHRKPSASGGEIIKCDNCSYEQRIGVAKPFSRPNVGYKDDGGWM
uniref:hypothetical protein n=1 Tax=Pararhizobium sp. IMCC3301 TaxID=3067904 RepID=UPI002740ECD0|nr:hypothetical protein [Pararhizobium sp. IMCC3301]